MNIRSKTIVKPIRVSKASLDDVHNIGVFRGSCHSLFIIDLLVDVKLLDVGGGRDFDGDLHGPGEAVDELDLDHEADDLGHGAVRDGGRVVDFHFFVGLDHASLKTDHAQLLQGQRVFGVIDVSDEFVDLVLVEGVVDLVIELGLSAFLHLVEAELVRLVELWLRVLHQNN
jgi:hypothetical protein